MDLLVEAAVRATVLACGVAVIVGGLRIRSPRIVHRAWTAVVISMLALPVWVTVGPEWSMPLLPPDAASVFVPHVESSAVGESSAAARSGGVPSNGSRDRLTWATATLTMYVAGVGLFGMRLLIGLWRARAIRRTAIRIEGRLTHSACVTPLTVGMIAPVVILPTDSVNWSEAELSAVLAHEEEHVRRRDPFMSGLALVNRAVFWFHPLAWWLHRKIAGLSEQACDEAVMSRGHDSDVYSACLLRFARRAAGAGGRIAPMATAMHGTGLRERLQLLAQHPSPPSRARLVCAAVAGLVLVVVCASASPGAAPVQVTASRNQAWPVETTEHFEIAHDHLPADRIKDAADDLEAAYTRLSGALEYDVPRRIRIVLVRRDGELTGQAGNVTSQTGSTRDGIVVLSLESLDRRNGIAVHELTHRFALDIVPETSRVAPVLIEGLAEHQRGAWTAADYRLTRTAAAAGAIPPVSVLVNTDGHWAHAVFDFVAAEHGAEGVRQLLFALRAHGTLPSAVPMAFGVTVDQFDRQFRGYMTSTFGQP